MCVQEAKAWGKRVAAHARSWAIKQCVRHGIEVIYHASFADEEALDLLEANKDEHFVAPGLAWLINTSHHASQWGLTPEVTKKMGYHRELEVAIESMKAMRKRGIRILPGGDYGFAWTPHGTNAKDLEYFVKYLGMSADGGAAVGHRLGRADDEDGQATRATSAKAAWPTSCWSTAIRSPTSRILQDKSRILAVMKDGEFHRAPPVGRRGRSPRTRHRHPLGGMRSRP